jgi:hypothetical protein
MLAFPRDLAPTVGTTLMDDPAAQTRTQYTRALAMLPKDISFGLLRNAAGIFAWHPLAAQERLDDASNV